MVVGKGRMVRVAGGSVVAWCANVLSCCQRQVKGKANAQKQCGGREKGEEGGSRSSIDG